jgi:hypothetical protein
MMFQADVQSDLADVHKQISELMNSRVVSIETAREFRILGVRRRQLRKSLAEMQAQGWP